MGSAEFRAMSGVALGLLLLPVMLMAQNRAREFHADVRPVAITLGLAWRVAPSWYAGVTLGGGIDELARTLRPSDRSEFHDLEQLLHGGMFVRRKVSQSFDLDIGTRAGFGSVRSCDASDCWPGVYGGIYAGVFGGSRKFKVGTRLMAGRVGEVNQVDNFLHWEFLTGRFATGF